MTSSRSLSEIAESGNMLATLESVRDEIVADLMACESMRDKAALYLRLSDTLKTIDAIRPPEAKGDAVDEIAARRAARRTIPAPSSPRAKNSG